MKYVLALILVLLVLSIPAPVATAQTSCADQCLEDAANLAQELFALGHSDAEATQLASQYYYECVRGCPNTLALVPAGDHTFGRAQSRERRITITNAGDFSGLLAANSDAIVRFVFEDNPCGGATAWRISPTYGIYPGNGQIGKKTPPTLVLQLQVER